MVKKVTPLSFAPRTKKRVCHFFASSVADWRVSNNPEDLIKTMKSLGYDFNLFLVPAPKDAEYEISNYAPQFPGSVWIGYWGKPE